MCRKLSGFIFAPSEGKSGNTVLLRNTLRALIETKIERNFTYLLNSNNILTDVFRISDPPPFAPLAVPSFLPDDFSHPRRLLSRRAPFLETSRYNNICLRVPRLFIVRYFSPVDSRSRIKIAFSVNEFLLRLGKYILLLPFYCIFSEISIGETYCSQQNAMENVRASHNQFLLLHYY